MRAIIQWRSSDVINADIKEIVIKDSFDGFLKKFQARKEFKNLSEKEQQKTMEKVFSFLNRSAALETNKKPNTNNISGMFNEGKWIQTIIDITKPEIKHFFQLLTEKSIKLTSITGMQMWKWIPDLEKLEKFVEFLEEKNILLSSITGMQNWKWIPNLGQLEEFIKICREENLNIKEITWKQLWVEESIKLARNK